MKVDIEFIEEVDKLLKYCTEMRIVTGYKGGIKPNVQLIRNYVIKFQGGKLKDEHCSNE